MVAAEVDTGTDGSIGVDDAGVGDEFKEDGSGGFSVESIFSESAV